MSLHHLSHEAAFDLGQVRVHGSRGKEPTAKGRSFFLKLGDDGMTLTLSPFLPFG